MSWARTVLSWFRKLKLLLPKAGGVASGGSSGGSFMGWGGTILFTIAVPVSAGAGFLLRHKMGSGGPKYRIIRRKPSEIWPDQATIVEIPPTKEGEVSANEIAKEPERAALPPPPPPKRVEIVPKKVVPPPKAVKPKPPVRKKKKHKINPYITWR